MMEMTDLPLDYANDHDDEQEQERHGENSQNIPLRTQISTAGPSDEGSWSDEEERTEGRDLLHDDNIESANGSSKMQSFDIEELRSDYRSRSAKRKRQREQSEQPIVYRVWKWHWFGGNDGNDDDNQPWLWYHNNPQGGDEVQTTVLLDPVGVKFFKFVAISIGCLLLVHFYAQIVDDKRDTTYGLREMVLYDGNLIALDLIVLFVVGRLYERQGSVDTCEFVVPTLSSALIQSYLATHVTSLQHSVTKAEIACGWTWQMWVLVALAFIPLLLTIGGAHVVSSIHRGIGMRMLIEVVATFVVFLLPFVFSSTFFHLHHWYYGWIVAMHCNIDVWWSRLCQAIFFGIYVNGVAIFGRDPIMMCAVSLYRSQNQECPYIESYENYTLADLAHDSGLDFVGEGGCNATG